jgi:hypothetical protein
MNNENEINPVPPIIQPGGPPPLTSKVSSLGDDPVERISINGVIPAFEALLRQPRRVLFQLTQTRASWLIAGMVLIAVFCSLVYGLVVGTFSGGDQIWVAPLKVAAGLLISCLICFPSLYIFSCLSGSQARLVEVAGLVAGLLALMTILLLGLAPVAWVFSQSTGSIATMGVLHWMFCTIGVYFGLRFLKNGCFLLNARTTGYLKVWMVIFPLVVVQMATALRPIVGTASTILPTEKKFFLTHWAECLRD